VTYKLMILNTRLFGPLQCILELIDNYDIFTVWI